VSKSMIRQGLEALNKALEARVARSEGQEGIEYKPPSEAEFAAAVAKDMAGQVLSSKMMWLAIAVVIVIATVAVILISAGRGG